MSSSLLDIIDEYGTPTGVTDTRENCFKYGLLKRCSWIFFVCRKRWILFQKRATDKKLFPGLLDFTAAGHIDTGEQPREAAIREISEELGIKLSPEELIFEGMFPSRIVLDDHRINNERGYLYIVDWSGRKDDFHLQSEEVESLKWISFSELEVLFQKEKWPRDFVPHTRIIPFVLVIYRIMFS